MKYISKQKMMMLFACIATLSGCNNNFFLGKDNSVQPVAIVQVVSHSSIKPVWSASVGGGMGKHTHRFLSVISGNKVIAADPNGNVVALDQSTGAVLWKTDIGRVHTGVGVGINFAFVTNNEAELIALNLADGKVAWKKRISGNAVTAPASKNGQVIVRTISGAVMAFDESTGATKWVYSVAQPDIVLSGAASPIFVEDVVLVPTDMGQLGLLEAATGKVLWGKTFNRPKGASVSERLADIDSSIVVEGRVIFVSMVNSGVSALSLLNGSTYWESKLSSSTGMGVAQDTLYAVNSDSTIVAIEKQNGVQRWSSDALKGRQLTQPIVVNNAVLVGDFEGYVHAIDLNSGALLGSMQVSKAAFLPDAVRSDSGIYLQDKAGKLYKFSL